MAIACTNAWSQVADVVPAGGLIVRLGCSDTQALMALRKSDNVIVHGLDADPSVVGAARKQIDATGRYGPISVGHFDGKHLPHADNLVNLVVIQDARFEVRDEEILRVLAPGGLAVALDSGLLPQTLAGRHRPMDALSPRCQW